MGACRIEKGQNNYKILGLISFDTVTHLYNEGIELLNTCSEVQLDFAEVTHADSSAIALLLNWLRYAKKNNKKYVFHNLPGQLLEIANVCEVMPFLAEHITGTGATKEAAQDAANMDSRSI